MIRAMLLAVYACALPSASALVASPCPFSARGVPQSKRIPEVACALKLDPDQLRDLKTIDNYIYALYDIVFKDSLPPNVTQDNVTQHFTSCATEFNDDFKCWGAAEYADGSYFQRWSSVVATNSAFYSRLNVGVIDTAQRAVMQSIPIGIQQHKLGSVDAEGYKAYIKAFGEFTIDNQDILVYYENLLAFPYIPPPPPIPPPIPPPPTGGCHPAGSYLTLKDGKSIAIERAAVGTLVKAETGFQPILGFLHAYEDLVVQYLRFTTPSASMAISPRHHVFVNGTETDPSFIELGDLLHTPYGLEPVTRIETLEARGAYHILVKGGSYYADGILTSDYHEAVSREVWPLVRDYVEVRHSLGIPVIPNGRGVFPRHDWVSGLLARAGVPLWTRKTVLSPLIVASSILTELANVAVECFPTWLSTAVALTVTAKIGRKLRSRGHLL